MFSALKTKMNITHHERSLFFFKNIKINKQAGNSMTPLCHGPCTHSQIQNGQFPAAGEGRVGGAPWVVEAGGPFPRWHVRLPQSLQGGRQGEES